MREFTIAPSCLVSVDVRTSTSIYAGVPKDKLTADDVVKILKGHDIMTTTSNIDHPEFDKLRVQLGNEGFIKITRASWNGDIVLKEFRLNGQTFKKGETFPCAPAMPFCLKTKMKYSKKVVDKQV